jgi:hypothetical protein
MKVKVKVKKKNRKTKDKKTVKQHTEKRKQLSSVTTNHYQKQDYYNKK